MCELLGMSANTPTDIRFSFSGLATRGGRTGPHRDGWGIAFYDGRAARSFLDTRSSADSEIAQLVSRYPIKSEIVIAHIRRANRGKVALANTHPFVREAFGRHWTFAHNGQLGGVKRLALGRHAPVGGTDSEHAFCWLLGQLEQRFDGLPARPALAAAVADLSAQLARLGVFNMLLSDSRSLYAFAGTRLCWLTRRAPFGLAHLADDDLSADFSAETTPNDVVTVVATRPLTTNEAWTQIEPGALAIFRQGEASVIGAASPMRSRRPQPRNDGAHQRIRA